MEELFERLVIAVEQQNSAFPWDSVISILALIASWVTIFFLLKERSEKNRPYMQISFELVRSTLACVVLRNVGTVPLEVKSLTFNETFTKQLQTKTQDRLKKKESTSIMIFPGQKWIVSFDTNVSNIINDFKEKTVKIDYRYFKYGKKKPYDDKVEIDFSEYAGFLDYISEVDEFKNCVDNLKKSMESIDKDTKKLAVLIEDGENNGQECNKKICCLGKNRADRPCFPKRCGIRYHGRQHGGCQCGQRWWQSPYCR